MLQAGVWPGGLLGSAENNRKTQVGCVLPNFVYPCILCMYLTLLFLFLVFSPKGYHPHLHSDKAWGAVAEIFSINVPELTRVLSILSRKGETPKKKPQALLFNGKKKSQQTFQYTDGTCYSKGKWNCFSCSKPHRISFKMD